MMRWLSRLLAISSISAALMAPAQAEKRVALVIGNNDYRNVPKLQKAAYSRHRVSMPGRVKPEHRAELTKVNGAAAGRAEKA